MKKALTDRFITALARRGPGKQEIVWDATLPSFAARVTAKGKIAWIVCKRPAGSKQLLKVTLGHHPLMTLKAAREAARAALNELLDGRNPTAERKHRHAAQAESDGNTFATVARGYINHVAGKRTAKQIAQRIERDLVSRWGPMPIGSITKRHIAEMVDAIQHSKGRLGLRKLGGPAAARQALVYCKKILRFAAARDLIESSPAELVEAKELIGPRRSRQRTLSDAEIRAIWNAAAWNLSPGLEPQDRGRWPFAPFLRCLLLLGVRKGELAKATWRQLDLDAGVWTIPSENAKSGQPHVVPLPAEAVRILRSLPRFAGGDVVFTNNGTRPLGSWTYLKKEIDEKSGIGAWVLHDARRTARTNWSRMGVQQHVAELMLGHARKGIEGTYDIWDFLPERRAALESWAKRIAEITAPPPESDKVVRLRA